MRNPGMVLIAVALGSLLFWIMMFSVHEQQVIACIEAKETGE